MLHKRKDSRYWYVTQTRESTGTTSHKLATEYARKALERHYRKTVLKDETRTFDELADLWLDLKASKVNLAIDLRVIARFKEFLLRRKVTNLEDIDSDMVGTFLKEIKTTISPSAANQTMHCLRAMLRKAVAKEWIDRVPAMEGYQVVAAPGAVITPEQFDAILVHLNPTDRLIARLANATGMRRSNCCGFMWEWVDADMRVANIPAVMTKTKRIYTVPLNNAARAILAEAKLMYGHVKSPYAFPEGTKHRSIHAVSCAFTYAARKLGLSVHFHDLRHTWASRHVVNGTPDRHLIKMGGWASAKMLEKYTHLRTEDLEKFAQNGE